MKMTTLEFALLYREAYIESAVARGITSAFRTILTIILKRI